MDTVAKNIFLHCTVLRLRLCPLNSLWVVCLLSYLQYTNAAQA